jgi:thioredoxin 1
VVRPVQVDRADPRRGRPRSTGRLKIAKINVDENQQVPAKFGIAGIPTLMLSRTATSRRRASARSRKSQLTPFLDSNI